MMNHSELRNFCQYEADRQFFTPPLRSYDNKSQKLVQTTLAVFRCLVGILVVVNLLDVASVGAANNKINREIIIVDDNRAKAVIAVNDDATDQVKSVAFELSRYIKLSTSAVVKVQKLSEIKNNQRDVIIIIKTVSIQKNKSVYLFAIPDEFTITFPDNKTIVISGSMDWGTEFGVYEFLERYIGVKWLMPSLAGEVVPLRKKLSVPMNDITLKSAFFSRHPEGLRGPEQYLWARHNRMHPQIKLHHNLLNLFSPAIYTKTHPEFFPMINGKRYLPKEGAEGWQPCFSAPGIVEEAIKNICEYFEKHPGELSYSLGVNDGGGYCECDTCRAKVSDLKNYLGFMNMSNIYFEWANTVVEGVLSKYPDKWFGCLAYSELAEAPSSVKVHPRIVPFLTYERLKWVDKRLEKQGKAITESWSKRGNSIGWYDYIYGTPYLVPRVYFHEMADYYRYGYEQGVRAMYAEAYPNWGEGPKLYVALKLLWNPYLDVDELLSDWYEKCVGKEAAPYLEAYYNLWEEFWIKKVPKSWWFSKGHQYLLFFDARYLDIIDDEIIRSRDILQKVVSNAQTSDQIKRANLIFKAFEYYEASVISYQYKGKCAGVGILSFGKDCDMYRVMNNKRYLLINKFDNDPVLIHPRRFDKMNILQW
ncbi:MAG: DUF4838 domain-containing protein [bacterium]